MTPTLSSWLSRVFKAPRQIRKTPRPLGRPAARLGFEPLECRVVPATDLTIVAGASGTGDLDTIFTTTTPGIITAGNVTAAGAGTLSVGALTSLLSTTDISIVSPNNIIFSPVLGTIALTTAAGHTVTLAANVAPAGSITFGTLADSLTTAGASLELDSTGTQTLANLGTGNGDIDLNAGDVLLGGTVNAGSGRVTIAQSNLAGNITVGGGGGGLGVSDAELGQITAGVVQIGATFDTGTITLDGSVTVHAGFNVLSLVTTNTTASAINQTAGTVTVANLALQAVGAITLNAGSNSVGTLAAATTGVGGTVAYTGGTGVLAVGTVDGVAGISTADQVVILIADDMFISQPIDTVGPGSGAAVTLFPFTPTRGISVGGGTTPGLGIGDAELGLISASVVRIGDLMGTGAIVVDGAVTTHAGYNTLNLITGNTTASAITQVAGGSLTVANLALQTFGGIALNTATLGNNVGTLAAATLLPGGTVSFSNGSNALTIGAVDGVTGITTSNADVTLVAGDLTVSNAISAGSGIVTLAPSAGTAVDLGTTTVGKFSITQAEINLVTAGVLRIGASNSGTFQITAAIASTAAINNTLTLISGAAMTQTVAGSIAATNLRLGGTGPVDLTTNANAVGTLSANLTAVGTGTLKFSSGTTALIIGTVDTVSGIATNNADVTLIADNLNVTSTIGAGTATVQLVPFTNLPTTLIDLGGAAVPGPFVLSLTNTELNNITAGVLRIGDSGYVGNITVSSLITGSGSYSNLSLINTAGGTIGQGPGATITLAGGLAIQSATSVVLNEANHVTTLAANAVGGIAFSNGTNLLTIGGPIDGVTGIDTVDANVTLTADDLDIQSPIHTVSLGSGGIVTLQPFTSARSISVGNGASGLGISDAELALIDGSAVRIGSAIAGSITVDGAVAAHIGYNTLHLIAGSALSTITQTGSGSLTVANLAVEANGQINLSTNANNVTTLAGATALGSLGAFQFSNGTAALTIGTVDGVAGVTTANSNITLIAGDLAVSGPINAGVAVVTLTPITGTAVDLGTNTVGKFSLTQAEINQVIAGVLRIGASDSGTFQITAAISSPTSVLTLISGGAMTQVGAGSIAATNLRLTGTGPVDLTTNANAVGTLSGDLTASGTGSLKFSNGLIPLTIGTVDGVAGIATNNADVTLIADDLFILNPINTESLPGTGGIVTLQPFTSTTSITIGLGASGPGILGISDTELGQITARVVRIGDALDTGTITLDGLITTHAGYDTLHLATGNATPGAITQLPIFTISVANLALEAAGGIVLTNPGNNVDTLAGSTGPTAGLFQYTDVNNLAIGTVDGVSGVTTASGAITVTTVGGNLGVNAAVSAGSASVQLAATGDVTVNAAVSVTGAGAITVTADSDTSGTGNFISNVGGTLSSVAGNINVAGANATVGDTVTSTGGGSVTVAASSAAGGSVAANGAIALTGGNGNVDLNSTGGVTVTAAVSVVGIGTITVHADILGTLGAGTFTNSGIGTLTTAGGAVTITAFDVSIGAAINATTGGALNLGPKEASEVVSIGDQSGDFGVDGTELGFVTASIVRIGSPTNTGGIQLTGPVIAATFSTLTLGTAGAITDNNATGTDITVTNLSLRAGQGIGSSNALDVAVSTLAALNSLSGNIQVANTGALTIGTVDVAPFLLSGVANNAVGGNILVSAASPIIVNTPVTDTGGGNITLTTSGASGDITLNSPGYISATGGSGNILLDTTAATSGGAITINASTTSPEISTIGAGTITLNAATNVTLNAGADINSTATAALSAGGAVSISGATVGGLTGVTVTAGTTLDVLAGSTVASAGGLTSLSTAGGGALTVSASTVSGATGVTITSGTTLDVLLSANVTAGAGLTSLVAGTALTVSGSVVQGTIVSLSATTTMDVTSSNVTAGGTLSLSTTGGGALTVSGGVVSGNLGTLVTAGTTLDVLSGAHVQSSTGATTLSAGTVLTVSGAGSLVSGLTGTTLSAGTDLSVNAGTQVGGGVTTLNIGTANTGSNSLIAGAVIGALPSVAGGTGNDKLTVDFTAGAILPLGLTFNGGTGANELDVSDANGTAAHFYTIGGTSVIRDVTTVIGTTNVQLTRVTGGNLADTFNVVPAAATAFDVVGGTPPASPGDTLTVSGGTGPLLTVSGTGTYSGSYAFAGAAELPVTFAGIESLAPSTVALGLTNTDSGVTTPGQQVTFTVTVTADPSLGVNGINFSNPIPAGLIGATWSSTALGGASGNTPFGTGNIGDTLNLPIGGSVVYTITGTINPSATGTLTNTATLTAPGGVTNTGLSPVSDSITLTPAATVPVSITAPSTGAIGEPITYVLTVTNSGPSTATGVTLAHLLPAGATIGTITSSQGTVSRSGLDLTAAIGTLLPGASATVTITVTPTTDGAVTLSVTGTSDVSSPSTASATIAVRSVPVFVVVGPGSGGGPQVRALNAQTGEEILSLFPFGTSYSGPISVAQGDVNGDGINEIIVGAGPGGGPVVAIYDVRTGNLVRSFFAYDADFRGGVNVAAGDVDGDGKADVITGVGPGGGPNVRIFDGSTGSEIGSFFAYDATFRNGVNVAAGDVDGDGKADVITGVGLGGGPNVRVFDGTTFLQLASFFAYDPLFRGGVNVAAGDVNGDGFADVLTGPGPSGSPNVVVFDGQTHDEIGSFFAFDSSLRGGVSITALDATGQGYDNIYAGTPAGVTPEVKVLDGKSFQQVGLFPAFDAAFLGGVYVG